MKSTLTALLFLLCFHITEAQWEQTHGPYGGTIFNIADCGNRIFAGTRNSGLFMSDNNGASWIKTTLNCSGGWIEAVAANDSVVFAGYNGLYRSTDYGNTWTFSLSGYDIRSVLAFQDTVLAASLDMVKISFNSGQSWSPLIGNVGMNNLKALAKIGNTIFVGSMGNGVRKTTLNGSSWEVSNNGLPCSMITSMTVCGNTVYAGCLGCGIYKSSDLGNSWVSVNIGLPDLYVYAMTSHGDTLWAGCDNGGVAMLVNGQSTWTIINNNLANTLVWAIHSTGNTLYVGTDGGGMNKTTDFGNNWTVINNGIINTSAYFAVKIGDNLYSGTDNGLFISQDSGFNWTKSNTGLDVHYLLKDSLRIYAACDYFQGLYLSNDNGNTWSPVSTPFSNYPVYDLLKSANRLFAATYHGLYYSDNDAVTWTPADSGIVIDIINCVEANGNLVIAGSFNGGAYVSLDGGLSWTNQNTGLPGFGSLCIRSMTSAGGNIYLVYSSNLYRYDVLSSSWVQVLNINPVNLTKVISKDDFLLVGAYDGSVLLSGDYGTSWVNIDDGLADQTTVPLAIVDDYIYISLGYSGIWRRPLSEVVGINDLKDVNKVNIYPNPASDWINININGMTSNFTSVEIYIVTGDLIKEEKLYGSNFTQFNIQGLTAGIYFLKLKSDKKCIFKKLIINK